MVIDFHTHIFPDKIATRTLEALIANVLEVEGIEHKSHTNGMLSGIKDSMSENGVDMSVVLPIATTVRQSTSINSFAAEINGKDNIFSFGSVHPMQEDWEAVLEHIKELGLLGIKLHPEYQQFFIDSPDGIKILKKCEELGLYVILHAGRDIGIRPPVHCEPRQLSNALQYVSGKNIIAAHMGGWRMWDDVEKYLVGTDVIFDTAYSVFEMDSEQLVRIIKNHGSEKIVFGTDSPWEKPSETIAKINSLPLTDTEKDNIFCQNAKNILNLN